MYVFYIIMYNVIIILVTYPQGEGRLRPGKTGATVVGQFLDFQKDFKEKIFHL